MELRGDKIKFKVVKFISENSFEVVPSTWTYKFRAKNYLYWPAVDNVRKLVRDDEKPSTNWPSFPVDVLKNKGKFII